MVEPDIITIGRDMILVIIYIKIFRPDTDFISIRVICFIYTISINLQRKLKYCPKWCKTPITLIITILT